MELIVIPSCNPDALETESSLNANNVDLDRNFPSKNWGKADLKGESLTRFYALKDLFGLKNDTELIRLLISQEYHRQFKKAD